MAETRIDELRRRLERDPGSRLFAQLAEEHRKAGDHAEAIRVARAGLAVHSAYPSARLTLGRALLDSGDAASARQELAEVVREAPDNILASRFLAQALEMAGDLSGALRQYSATLKMAPGDRQLEAQVSALRLRAQAGERLAPEVTAPMRPLAPPAVPARPPGPPAPVQRATPPPLPRPPVPAPPPTERMPPQASQRPAPHGTAEGPSPSEPTILIRPAAAAPTPPAPPLAAAAASRGPVEAAVEPKAEAAVSTARPAREPFGPQEPAPEEEAAPTLPRTQAPDLSESVSTLPPAARPPASDALAAEPSGPPTEESFDEPLDSAPAHRVGPADTVDAAISVADGRVTALPAATPERSPVTAEKDAAAATLAQEVAVEGASAPAPLSSSTLAELYLRQGLTERAREVYRQVLADDPGNERARSGLRDLEAAAGPGGHGDERAARRAALERTIAALEAMLAAVRRD